MPTVTSHVVDVNRQNTSDPRIDMRLTREFDDDDDATSVGWTWVVAVLIAGTLIVSGYLDQESADSNGHTVTTRGEKYAVNTATAPATRITVQRADIGRDKGYSQ